MNSLNWNKGDGLIPAIIQDSQTKQILMLGYMNPESLKRTQETRQVTFYSRTKQSLWTKGHTSGNTLEVIEILPDCDKDALLILVNPKGPTCHRNTSTCFESDFEFLSDLEGVIESRIKSDSQNSYVSRLKHAGLDRIAQKVGEEAIETVIASKNSDLGLFENEAADLMFHLMVLLQSKFSSMKRIVELLKTRHLTSQHLD